MAVAALPSQPATTVRESKWSFAGLLKEIRHYLWRYGVATDVETDPIELLQHAYNALDTQEKAFEKEQEGDVKLIEELRTENARLKAELAATKAKVPPWWKG